MTGTESTFQIPENLEARIQRMEINKNSTMKGYEMSMKGSQKYWNHRHCDVHPRRQTILYCLLSVSAAFMFGLLIGCAVINNSAEYKKMLQPKPLIISGGLRTLNSLRSDAPVAYNFDRREDSEEVEVSPAQSVLIEHKKQVKYPPSITEDMMEILKDYKSSNRIKIGLKPIRDEEFRSNNKTVLFSNIYWGPEVEASLPRGYGDEDLELWEEYLRQAEIVRMVPGCGRMQNRLVTFKDGLQACVRYRQNTDQIQGEIFSYYVSRLLNVTNLAPSVVKVVDVKDRLWSSVANEMATSQWNNNRPVVITQYIPSLESAYIPQIFKPSNRHLNKYDVFKMTSEEIDGRSKLLKKLGRINKEITGGENFDHIETVLSDAKLLKFVELAQWSDLILFDYLTANLDRIANNLFNYQWNENIMDGPAHNLARQKDTGLLVFLDNESGLLHGYRLLKKYNIYHSLMLDNLCVFRKSTIEALRKLRQYNSIGDDLKALFREKNEPTIRDVLPGLPEKNVKILKSRVDRVLGQVRKCEKNFSKS